MVKSTEQHLKGVDMFKLIMAMSVVAIHIASADCVTGVWPVYVEWFIRLAVPFFFITSGYLIASRLPERAADKKKFLLRRAKKIIRLFVYWIGIYLPISLYVYADNGHSFIHNLTRYIWQLVILGESKYAYPLWYLYSLAIVLAIYALSCNLRKSEYKLFALYALVFVAGWLGDSGLIGNVTAVNLCNWISLLSARTLGGGIYVMIGVIMYKRNLPKDYCWIVCAISVSVALCYFSLPFWELFGGIAVFMVGYRITSLPSLIAKECRYESMWIYYMHMYVIFAMICICRQMSITINIWLGYVMALSIVIMIAICLLRLQDTKSFSWLKCLVS